MSMLMQSSPAQSTVENRLLSALSAEDFARLAPSLERIHLPVRFLMGGHGGVMDTVYFPETAVASLLAISPDGNRVEAGLFGAEGMSGLPVLLAEGRSPHDSLIQVEGNALRMPADAFAKAAWDSPTLMGLMLRYAQTSSVQVAHTALSNALHTINERLARWILMCHDRVPTDQIALTHDFMALMLGTRRSSVTLALQTLEGSGLIRSLRGQVVVRDRAGLEEFAGDAYGAPEAEYERLIGPMPRPRSKDGVGEGASIGPTS